jgi:hypothetical protein
MRELEAIVGYCRRNRRPSKEFNGKELRRRKRFGRLDFQRDLSERIVRIPLWSFGRRLDARGITARWRRKYVVRAHFTLAARVLIAIGSKTLAHASGALSRKDKEHENDCDPLQHQREYESAGFGCQAKFKRQAFGARLFCLYLTAMKW